MTDRNEPKRFHVYCRRLFLRIFQWCSERLVKAKFRNGVLIKRRSILTGCLSLVLLSSATASLSAQTTQSSAGNGCDLPPKGSAPRIKIDVTAQGVSNRNLSYPNAKQVEILLTNMNPYKYRYSISTRQSTEADVVSGALIKELLKAAGVAEQRTPTYNPKKFSRESDSTDSIIQKIKALFGKSSALWSTIDV